MKKNLKAENYKETMTMLQIDWSHYPNFTPKELACKHCGADGMTSQMMDVLQYIRNKLAKPMFLSSGYRCPRHPVEQEKDKPGEHTKGMAVDILCHGINAIKIIDLALEIGTKRIGIHQKGNINGRFIHLGIADKFDLAYPEAIWTY